MLKKQLAGKKILIVDDEAALREVIVEELLDIGAVVSEAANGTQALEQCSKTEFAAVITDVRMPGGDGMTLLHKLQHLSTPKPIVVLITGYSDLSNEVARAKGASALFVKPFDIEALIEALAILVHEPRQDWVRKNIRHDITINIKVKDEKSSAAIEATVLNISQCGFFIRFDANSLPIGTRLIFSIDLGRDSLSRVTGSGIVRWSREAATAEGPAGVGVEFEELSADASEQISRLLQRIRTKTYDLPG